MRSLRIDYGQFSRYFKKSINLALCYAGFADKRNFREAWLAGKSAFFCSAYDVVTDWMHYSPEMRTVFERIIYKQINNPEILTLTFDLYKKEQHEYLDDDGLERGSVALRCILKVMECESDREERWGDLDNLGILLQIVDDVLDYESDVERKEMNCLSSSNSQIYLEKLLTEFGESNVKSIFGGEPKILSFAIKKATIKASSIKLNNITNTNLKNPSSLKNGQSKDSLRLPV